MLTRLTSHWWLFLVRGILALLLGIVMLLYPGAAIYTVALFFGAYALVDGLIAIWASIRMNHAEASWGWLLLEGILGVLVGVITFFYPGVTVLWLSYLLGAWALVTGVLAIASAIRLRTVIANEVLWIIAGLVSVAFGILVFFAPGYGALAIVVMLAAYAILAGIAFIGLAFRLRGLGKRSAGIAA